MEIRDIPRKMEDWEFQELLRQLADNNKTGGAIPQLKYASKEGTQTTQRKHMFDPNRDIRVSLLGA